VHTGIERYDTIRTELLAILKLKVIRFSNDEVVHNMPLVLDKISFHCVTDHVTKTPPTLPSLVKRSEARKISE
jgi:very-short-patch-repair endonuclease